jgi:hypothetical protein
LVETHLQLYQVEETSAYVKDPMIASSQLFGPEMLPNRFLHLPEIVDKTFPF